MPLLNVNVMSNKFLLEPKPKLEFSSLAERKLLKASQLKAETVLVPQTDLFVSSPSLVDFKVNQSSSLRYVRTLAYLLMPSVFHLNQKEEATGTYRHRKKMPKFTLDNSFRFGSRRETITHFHSESIETILKKLTKDWLGKFAREEQIQVDLIGWKKMLVKINEVLDDAVEKQTKKEGVKKWLGELRNLACDVDYLLDEFQTEAFQRMLLQDDAVDKSDNSIVMSKVKEVTARLQDIASQIELLDLGKKSGGKSRNVRRLILPKLGGGRDPGAAIRQDKDEYERKADDDDEGRRLGDDDDEQNMPSSGDVVTPIFLTMFTLKDLRAATKNFRHDTKLGEGAFGGVFKGWVDHKTLAPTKVGVGMAVAVKKSNPHGFQGLQEWQAEVKFLGKFSHPNLVKLIGYCWEDKQFLLVYEYMQKGSLENHLFRKGTAEPLPWNTRLRIAIDAAKCLTFLHSSERSIIYRDFKASNILLDGSYNAKLSGFGLAKFGPTDGNSHVTTRVMGTYGYAAPEYVATGHLYVKSDVYGFGVVLLEMLTGLRAFDAYRPSGERNLADFARPSLTDKRRLKKIMDPRLEEQYPIKAALLAGELIIKCLVAEPKNRPSMEEVLETLQKMSVIEIDPKKKAKD